MLALEHGRLNATFEKPCEGISALVAAMFPC